MSGNLVADLQAGRTNSQILDIFIVELENEASAQTLIDVARRKRPEEGISMLALAERRLFCLLTARSFEYGVRSVETPESVRRFQTGLAEILRRHAKG